MDFFKRLSFSKKVIGVILLVTIFGLGTGFAIFIWKTIDFAKSDMEESFTTYADLAAEYCINPMKQNNPDVLKEILTKLKKVPEIQQVCVYDRQGKLYAVYVWDEDDKRFPSFPKHWASKVDFHEDYLQVFYPIKDNDQYLGLIYIKASTDKLWQEIQSQVFWLLLLFVAIMVFSSFLARYLQNFISRPIQDLITATQEVSDKNDFSLRVSKKNEDETGILIDKFNEMLEHLEIKQRNENENKAILAKNESKYRSIFENSVVGIMRADLKTGKIIESNARFRDMFGVENHDEIDSFEIFFNRHSTKERIRRQRKIALEEVQIRRKDDKTLWVSVKGKLYDDDLFECVIEDVTEVKKNIIELKKVNEELDNFIYHASHEFRSPLLSILGLVNLMRKEEDNQDSIRICLIMLENTVKRLDDLLNETIEISKGNRLEHSQNLIDWQSTVQSCMDDLIYLDEGKKIKVDIDIIQTNDFYSDITKINGILRNMISNAIQFKDESKVQPYLKIEIRADEKKAKIKIQDNGEGILGEEISKIFNMFYRASLNSERAGLGLYIVKNALSRLNGRIIVQSELNVGSTFMIEIPNQIPNQILLDKNIKQLD